MLSSSCTIVLKCFSAPDVPQGWDQDAKKVIQPEPDRRTSFATLSIEVYEVWRQTP